MSPSDPGAIDDLTALSALLDEALDLDPAERSAWLERLAPAARKYHSRLQEMLARAGGGAAQGLIDHLPPMQLPLHLAPEQELAPDDLVGPYRLLRVIGRGGMGTVWLAERVDGVLSRQVALKLPLVNMSHKMLVQRFERERDILAGLEHPHIARLYDAGFSAGGQPYLAMEYVQGEDLTHYCDERRLSLLDRLELFRQVLDAVQYAHANLVVHRDLKPANILVSADARVHLLDFGIAKLLAADDAPSESRGNTITKVVGMALTPDYASPEQFLNEPVSIASDIYSLGVLLYELLSGGRPYAVRTSSRAQVEQAILSDQRTAPSAMLTEQAAQQRGTKLKVIVRRLRGDLDNIILKALKAKPADRYATVYAFAEDLQRWRAGEPVQARADSRWYRLQRFVARNKLVFGAGVTVFLSLAVGLGLALWQAQLARTEAQISKATEEFLVGLFQANSVNQGDPAKAQQTTARELLDLGAKRITDSLTDAPEAKLRLLYTLADLYGGLQLPEPGARLVKQMAALRQQLHPGPTLERAQDLMDIVTGGGNVTLPAAELKSFVDEAESILDAHGDKTSALRAQLLLSQAQAAAPDWSACARYARQAVDVARRLPPNFGLIDALFTYGRCEGVSGDPALALASAQEGLKLIDSAVKSEYHRPLLLATQAMMQLRLSQLAESIASASQAQQALDGQTGSKSTGQVDVLADSLVAGARPKEALAAINPRVAWDLAHPERADRAMLARVLDTRARVLIQLGDVDGAMRDLALAQSTVAGFEPGNWLDAYRWETVAAVRLAQGRLEQAQCSLKEAQAMREKRHERRTVRMNYQTTLRIALLLRSGQFDAAREQLGSFVTEPASAGAVSRTELERQLLQSEILLASSQWAPALLTSSALLEKIQQASQSAYLLDLTARALSVKGQALLETGQGAQARMVLQKAADSLTSLYDARLSPTLAHTMRALARTHAALGRADEAARFAQQANAIEKRPRAAAPDKYFPCPVTPVPKQDSKA